MTCLRHDMVEPGICLDCARETTPVRRICTAMRSHRGWDRPMKCSLLYGHEGRHRCGAKTWEEGARARKRREKADRKLFAAELIKVIRK